MSTEKISILILEVDFQCEKCYRKIQKLLCKLQPKENIRKIDYDNKKNTVTIYGPFDPQELSKKLKCKACDVIKDIKIAKPEDKQPEVKNPEENPEEKKPEEKKTKEKPTAAAPPPWSSTTTVNFQLTNMCGICYPWPCSDPTHRGVQQPPSEPQRPPFEHHQHQLPWGKWSPCGGPSYCGGCGSCRGAAGMHGWPVVPMRCPGPSACRGCNGCRIVRESKFSYEEYPPSACAIM